MRRRVVVAVAAMLAAVVLVALAWILVDALDGDEDAVREASAAALALLDGPSSEAADALAEANLESNLGELFAGPSWDLIAGEPDEVTLGDREASATAGATATIELPESVGALDSELLLFGGEEEATLPLALEVELVDEDGEWEVDAVEAEDPFPLPAEPAPEDLTELRSLAKRVAASAFSMIYQLAYEQPPVYATPEASRPDARRAFDGGELSVPPYLVRAGDLFVGPVDAVLVDALFDCQYISAKARVRPPELSRDADEGTAAHVQVVSYRGEGSWRAAGVHCPFGGRETDVRTVPFDYQVQLARSRLEEGGPWRVTRLAVAPFGVGARDVYNVAGEVLDDETPAGRWLPGPPGSDVLPPGDPIEPPLGEIEPPPERSEPPPGSKPPPA